MKKLGCRTKAKPTTGLEPAISHSTQAITGCEPELSGLRMSMTPLIVYLDDEPIMLDLVKLILGHSPYRVECFVLANPALAFCHQTRPNLLVTDLGRPDIDGRDVCQIIRDDPFLHDLPILVASAQRMTPVEQRWLRVDYLSKPFSPAELVYAIGRLVYPGRL